MDRAAIDDLLLRYKKLHERWVLTREKANAHPLPRGKQLLHEEKDRVHERLEAVERTIVAAMLGDTE